MRTRRFRWTIRQTMWWVIVAAIWCANWVYLQRWEARRTVMYQQRDVTRSIMLEAKQDIVAAGHSATEIRIERPLATYTAEWTEWFEAWENRGGQKLSLIRATASGDSGWFSLQPIIVETYGSKLDAAWLDRLLRTYREKGWRYKVIEAAGSEYSRKHQEWIRNEKHGILLESTRNGSATRSAAFFPNEQPDSRDRMRSFTGPAAQHDTGRVMPEPGVLPEIWSTRHVSPLTGVLFSMWESQRALPNVLPSCRRPH